MNSSDDSTDKALKERFQQVFKDFERTPSRSLKKRIWQQIAAAPTRRSRYVALAVLLLLLIGGALYGPRRTQIRRAPNGQSNRLVFGQSRRPIPGQTNAVSPQAQTRSAVTLDRVAVVANGDRATDQPVGSSAQPTIQKVQSDNLVSDTKATLPRQSVYAPTVARAGRSRLATNQVRLSPVLNQANQSVDRGPTFRTEKQANPNLALSTPVRILSGPAVSDRIVGQEALIGLQPVAIRQSRVPVYTITRPMVQLPQQLTEATAESRPVPLRWLASVSPLSTFQLMTIMARPETYVQQVDAPSSFSSPTWGYQVSGGLVWQQFAVQLTVGQLRRWAYYDLATNEYRIEPTGLNEYRVTRLGRSVAENSSLTMLGAGLTKEYTLGKRPGRYAARVGGQGTYLPATGQTLLWGQAALTMGIPLKNAYSLQLGPTVQYGFSPIFSNDRQLVIHPFLVGASLTIRPTAN
ncbi:hypothetical protein [uncultured Fibrella sp.]|uniref:hypothetical protein n=1 Tax=uncultured Fibrella sp. TaxID=1284596 RepID=UPI0035CC924D